MNMVCNETKLPDKYELVHNIIYKIQKYGNNVECNNKYQNIFRYIYKFGNNYI